MNRLSLQTLWVIPLVAVSSPLRAEGWKMPSLNPFAKKETASMRGRESDDKSWFRPTLPKMPSFGMASKSDRNPVHKSREPSMLQRMGDGTKEAFGKTKNVLMPWTKDDKPAKRSSVSRNAERKSLFSSVFGAEEEPQRIETVNDFLRQPTVE